MSIAEIKKAEAIRMAQAGMSVTAICKDLAISKPSVYKLLASAGIKPVTVEHEDAGDIVKQYQDSSMPVKQILRDFGLTYGALYTLLRAHNVEVRTVTERGGRKMALDQAVKMYLAGTKIHDIQPETGVSACKLYAELAARQIQPNRQRSQDGQNGNNDSS